MHVHSIAAPSDTLLFQKPSYFEPVLKHYRSQSSSISFASEAEKIPTKILKKKSFIAKTTKLIDKKDENTAVLNEVPETHDKKSSCKKKVAEKYSFETSCCLLQVFQTSFKPRNTKITYSVKEGRTIQRACFAVSI